MEHQEERSISKLLSLALRHRPKALGLTLDRQGWAEVVDVLEGMLEKGHDLDESGLRQVVQNNDKQRFSLTDDGQLIRANQGHSVAIDLELIAVVPPETLYHGTVARKLPSIRAQGLLSMNRHHVHLSADVETAERVARRRGKAVILTIASKQMHEEGIPFFCSENGVWLTEKVPREYISFPS